MADRLRVTELDFDAIKQNLKAFLQQQSEFTDYDFEGSGMAVLLDVLAYNTHYNAYYLNMVAIILLIAVFFERFNLKCRLCIIMGSYTEYKEFQVHHIYFHFR